MPHEPASVSPGPPPAGLLPGGPAALVLVCRKCSKKLGGGFGPDGRKRLARALRRHAGAKGKLSAKKNAGVATVIETGCLGLCPKGRVVAVGAGTPPRICLVRPGAELGAVAATLGLGPKGG